MSWEAQYMLPIISNENNSEQYSELLDEWVFVELEEYKTMLDILARGKLASTLDNMPSER